VEEGTRRPAGTVANVPEIESKTADLTFLLIMAIAVSSIGALSWFLSGEDAYG
jgi:hypothetical protein